MWKKVNVKKFCDDSTMHGFKELYYSTNGAKKTFWSLLIVGAIGITIYQVFDAVSTYQQQPTLINVHPMEEEIVAPDIHLCFDIRYVFTWISFTTLNKLDVETDKTFFQFLCRFLGLNVNCYSIFADNVLENVSENSFLFYDDPDNVMEHEDVYYTNMEKQNISNEFLFIKQFIAFPPNFIVVGNLEEGRMFLRPKKMFFNDGFICYTYPLNYTKRITLMFSLERNFEESTNKNFSLSDISSITKNPTVYNMLKYIRNVGVVNTALDTYKVLNFTTIDTANILMLGIGNVRPVKLTSQANNILDLVSISKFVALDRASKPCKTAMSTPSFYNAEINMDGSDTSCYNLCMYEKQNVKNNFVC